MSPNWFSITIIEQTAAAKPRKKAFQILTNDDHIDAGIRGVERALNAGIQFDGAYCGVQTECSPQSHHHIGLNFRLLSGHLRSGRFKLRFIVLTLIVLS